MPNRTEANRQLVERLKIPPEAVVSFWAIDWFNSVKEFRDLETENVEETKSEEHRAAVSQLIAQGEGIVVTAKRTGLAEGVEFDLDDIRATVSLLKETLVGIHGPHNHPETNKRILEILNV